MAQNRQAHDANSVMQAASTSIDSDDSDGEEDPPERDMSGLFPSIDG